MKEPCGISRCQIAQVVGNMKIKRVLPGCLENNIFRMTAQLLYCQNKLDREFGILRTEEYFYPEVLTLQKGKRF